MPYNLYKFFQENLDLFVGNFGDMIPGVAESINFTANFQEYGKTSNYVSVSQGY